MSEQKQEIDLTQYEQDMEKQRKRAGDDAREKERLRVQGINDIYEKFRSYVPEFIRRKAVDEGMPLQEYQDIVLKRIGDGSPIDTPVTDLGLSKQEIRRYSITRAILSQWKESGVDASFERACHSEIERRLGNASRGIFVPFDVMRQPADPKGTGRRDLSVGTAAAGGYLVERPSGVGVHRPAAQHDAHSASSVRRCSRGCGIRRHPAAHCGCDDLLGDRRYSSHGRCQYLRAALALPQERGGESGLHKESAPAVQPVDRFPGERGSGQGNSSGG